MKENILMENQNKIGFKEWYSSQFNDFEKSLNGQLKTPLHLLRKQAIEKFNELGFPTTQNEEWKFTNVSRLLNYKFVPAILNKGNELGEIDLQKYLIKNPDVNLIVFFNGKYLKEYSKILPQAKGVEIKEFSSGLLSDLEFIQQNFSNYLKNGNGFIALNTAFSLNGVIIKIPDNLIINEPIHLLYLSGDSTQNLLIQPRNVIICGKNSQLKIIESFHSLSENPYLFNSVSEIILEENSVVDYYKVQNEEDSVFHINRMQVILNRSSVFTSLTVTMGGEIIRNDLNAELVAENSECHFLGFYLADGNRLLDNHTLIDHAKPHCHSNEFYKGILEGKSRAVFNGKVIVRKDAQKTLAYQSNKNLLLSKEAKINTKPQLEIFADDVKCSHGATVGQLDEQSLFYLQSRGITKEKAKSMLIKAFANDILELIKIDSLKEQLNDQILERLNQASL
jgi:Fe-S cluster assembly protein SufD